MQGTNAPWTRMSEAARMSTSSHPSAPRMRISWFFLAWMLKLSNELDVSTSFVIVIHVTKMQSNLQPFQTLMSYHEDAGTSIQNMVSASLTGLNHTCSGGQGKRTGGLRKPHLQNLPWRFLHEQENKYEFYLDLLIWYMPIHARVQTQELTHPTHSRQEQWEGWQISN